MLAQSPQAASPPPPAALASSRAQRVRKNLRLGLSLAWSASPQSLIRFSVLGIVGAAMPPLSVYLGATLVNRIADGRLRALTVSDLLPIVVALWLTAGLQRALGAYMGYGRNLFVRRVELEAERRLLMQPCFLVWITFAATCLIRSSVPTELPPYFCTIIAILLVFQNHIMN